MQVLKIGGSVFAREAFRPRVDRAVLTRLAEEIVPHVGAIVVVHGAGHHPRSLLPASKIELRIPAADASAVDRLRSALAEVHRGFLHELRVAGVPARDVALAVEAERSTDALAPAMLDGVRAALRDEAVPVVCGGIVGGPPEAFHIVSSDLVTEQLGLALEAERVVWATDVDGVVDPMSSKAGPIPSLDEHPSHLTAEWTSSTGAMAAKVEAALRLASAGIESIILNGTAAGRVAAALGGREVVGTRVAVLPTDG